IDEKGELHLGRTIKDRPRIDRINGFVISGRVIFAANKEGWITAIDRDLDSRGPGIAAARNVAELDGVGKPHDIDWCHGLVVVDPAGFGRRNVPGTVAFYDPYGPSVELLPGEKWK